VSHASPNRQACCSFSKSINAQKAEVAAEAAVWRAVSTLLTDPESLRRDLEAMIERERKTHGDPEPEVKAWTATLSEVERKRDRHQEMFAADAMTLEELRSKLDALEERRETARRELAALSSWRESLEALERDKDRLLESYTTLAPRRWLTWTLRSAARYTLCLVFVSKRCRIRA